jgi:hypothetical protein
MNGDLFRIHCERIFAEEGRTELTENWRRGYIERLSRHICTIGAMSRVPWKFRLSVDGGAKLSGATADNKNYVSFSVSFSWHSSWKLAHALKEVIYPAFSDA